MTNRTAILKRKTTETDIAGVLNIDGTGKASIDTGIGLLNHMLELFAFHGLFDLEIRAKGDLHIDIHHTNEDVGIELGKAFKKALGEKIGIARNGSASFPMEDVVATVVVDISGRSFFKFAQGPAGEAPAEQDGYSLKYAEHFFESFASHLGMNLSITLNAAVRDLHTTLEPIFKALGKALDQATQIDPRRNGVPSTKGIID
jgi:imidazoleglycerol-phosphate dehydratase